MTIAEMVAGFFRTAGENETTLISTKDDPPKHRQGVLARVLGTLGGRGLGCLSFNVVHEDNNGGLSEDEHVLIQGKRAEGSGGELYVGLKFPDSSSTDSAMDDILVINHAQGIISKLPIYAPNFGTTPQPPPPDPFKLTAPGGEFTLEMQGDGNLTLCDRNGRAWGVVVFRPV